MGIGIASTGMNTPEIKTMAIRTTVAGGIACGMSRKGAERNRPNAENSKEETNTPSMNRGKLCKGEKGNIIKVYAVERTVPKKKPAKVLPSIIVDNEVGAARSMLNVPVLLSKGSDMAWVAPRPKKDTPRTKTGSVGEGSPA